MNASSRKCSRVAAVALGALMLAACPVPVARTHVTTPSVLGWLGRADGSPIHGAALSASDDYRNPCASPLATASTDSAGRFTLAATRHRDEVTWLTGFEGGPFFYLCGPVGDSVAVIHRASVEQTADAAPDTIDCMIWSWESEERVACNGSYSYRVVHGGEWGESGTYRVILHEDPHGDASSQVFVQWLERTGTDRWRVVDTQQVPITSWRVHGLWNPQLSQEPDQPLSVRISGVSQGISFRLGAPGEILDLRS